MKYSNDFQNNLQRLLYVVREQLAANERFLIVNKKSLTFITHNTFPKHIDKEGRGHW